MSFLNRSSAARSSCASCWAFSSWSATALTPRSRAALKRFKRRSATGSMAATSSLCLAFVLDLDRGDPIDLEIVVPSARVELGLEVEHDVRIGDGLKLRRLVIGLERLEDVLGAVHEIENVGRVLAGIGAIEPRKRLHRLDAGKPAVDIHAAKQGLIEAGLELVGDKQDLVVRALERLGDVAAAQVRIERPCCAP